MENGKRRRTRTATRAEPDPYFQSRPSAAGTGTTRSPLRLQPRPENKDLIAAYRERRAAAARLDGVEPARVPPDALQASGSGLDPHISPAYADQQVARVARRAGCDAATRPGAGGRAHPGPEPRVPRRAAGQRARAQPGPGRPGPLTPNAPGVGECRHGARQAAGLPRCGARASARPTRCSTRATAGVERGTDVVVGFVETHGRAHTAELLDGPGGRAAPRARATAAADVRRDGRRRGAGPPARRSPWSTSSPTPTSPARRNAKRWQDVEELLAAGIDVITTVNIQHLESLNDVVEKITGVPQRETRARRGRPRGRPDRAGRHDPRGAAPPDGARQHLPAGEGRRRAGATTSGSATSPRCASWPCSGSPTGSTRRCSSYRAAARHRAAPGRPASGSSSR